MSEAHFDEFEHYNFDQDKAMRSGHSGKWNSIQFQTFKHSILFAGDKNVNMETNVKLSERKLNHAHSP